MVFLYHFAIPRKLNVEDVMGLNPSREFGRVTSTGGKMVFIRHPRTEPCRSLVSACVIKVARWSLGKMQRFKEKYIRKEV